MLKKKIMSIALTAAIILTSIPMNGLITSAAGTPALHTGDRTIYVGKTFNYNVSNKMKGSKYQWTSSDTKVATVNNTNGVVTAKRAGSSTITLKVTANKKNYVTEAKVTIKENAKTVVISNAKAGSTVGIGKGVFDYNRKLTTASGGPSTDRTYFSIIEATNTAGATIDGYGVVSTKNPGSFEVIAKTAVTRNQYNLGNITATSPIVKVSVPQVISAELDSVNRVKVSSNASMKDLKQEDFTITNTATKQVQRIAKYDLSEDGLTAIITIESSFKNGSEYSVELAKTTLSSKFIAAYGKIARIVAGNQSIAPNVATAVEYTVYDSNGVDITAIYPYNMAGMDFSFTESKKMDTNGKITLPTKGDATFFTVSYVEADSSGKITTITSNQGKITAVASTVDSILGWTMVPAGKTVDWNDQVHTIAIGESGRRLYLQFKDSIGGTVDTSKTTMSNLTYTSSDRSIIGIDQSTGLLYPYKTGSAVITVSDGSFSKTVTVTVSAARTATTLQPSKTKIQLSSESGLSDSDSIRFDLKDQYGNNMQLVTQESPTIKVISGNDNLVSVTNASRYVNKTPVAATNYPINDDHFSVDFKARTEGTATMLVTYGGKTATVTVTVTRPGVIDTYKPVLTSTTLDPNVLGDASTTLWVYAVDSNDIKIRAVHDGTFTVTNSDGKEVLSNQIINLDGYNNGDIINSSTLKLADGVYTVTIILGPVKQSTTFTVKSSSPVATVVRAHATMDVNSSDDVFTKILECLPVYVNGTNVSAFIDNATIDYTSYNENLLPSRTVTKNSLSFKYANFRADVRVNKISFKFGNQLYEISPNADITFTSR